MLRLCELWRHGKCWATLCWLLSFSNRFKFQFVNNPSWLPWCQLLSYNLLSYQHLVDPMFLWLRLLTICACYIDIELIYSSSPSNQLTWRRELRAWLIVSILKGTRTILRSTTIWRRGDRNGLQRFAHFFFVCHSGKGSYLRTFLPLFCKEKLAFSSAYLLLRSCS
jgi:hypothetical protein